MESAKVVVLSNTRMGIDTQVNGLTISFTDLVFLLGLRTNRTRKQSEDVDLKATGKSLSNLGLGY